MKPDMDQEFKSRDGSITTTLGKLMWLFRQMLAEARKDGRPDASGRARARKLAIMVITEEFGREAGRAVGAADKAESK